MKKAVGIDAVHNGAPKEWHPVKHHRRFVRVLEEQLAQDVEQKGQKNGNETCAEDYGNGSIGKLIAHWFNDGSEETHDLYL